MAETSYPFDNANAGEVEWSRMARLWWGRYGVNSAPGGTALAVSADGVGTRQVYVQPGVAQVVGFRYETDTLITLAAGANVSGNPRIDRVVLRLNTTTNNITCVIKPGTPASNPAPPTLDITDAGYEISLAQIFVAAGATALTAPNITDERSFIGLRAETISTITSPLRADVQPGAPVWVADRARALTYAGAVAGLIDPRKPQFYGAGVVNAAGAISEGNLAVTTICTLNIPASTGGVGNRYLQVDASMFGFITFDTVVDCALVIAGVGYASAQLNRQSGSLFFSHAMSIGPAALAIILTIKRQGGSGNATWSTSTVAPYTYIKATVIPTD